MSTITLTELVSILETVKELHPPEDLDDMMWVNQSTFDRLCDAFGVKGEVEPHCSLASIEVFVDTTISDGVVETGTYEIDYGTVKKVVRHRFFIGSGQ